MSEWLCEYQQGSFIDSRDTMNTWCIGKVLEINKESKYVKVRYDGWSEKWDGTFHFSSNRIAPFRKNSELYTGQKGIAIRDYTYSRDEVQRAEARLNELPESAFGVTQFLRGELFTLIDCLLVNDYKSISDLEFSIKFFMKTLEFIVIWMKLHHQHFTVLHEGENFLISPKAALAAAWPELMMTLKRLFGQDPRTSKNILSWTFIPTDYSAAPETEIKQKTHYFLINYFAKLEGFNTILQILSENE